MDEMAEDEQFEYFIRNTRGEINWDRVKEWNLFHPTYQSIGAMVYSLKHDNDLKIRLEIQSRDFLALFC